VPDHDAIVVGAGPAGLSVAATLGKRGVATLVLERSDAVGASWRGHYARLHLHTVRWLSHLPGLRFSRRHGNWVSRDGVVGYLENYVRHHELDVRTGVTVTRIERDGGSWAVETDRERLTATTVVVATGFNRDPFLPDWPGREGFTGELLHAAYYQDPEPYRDRDVLVVGSGNTGAEIAVDLVEGGAGRVWMAIRTPPAILRRDINGFPNQLTGVMIRRLPPTIVDPMIRTTQRVQGGNLEKHGIPLPPRGSYTKFLEDGVVPILDVGLAKLVKTGRVGAVGGVVGFDRADVLLADGARISPDAVIASTGYRRGLEPLVGHLGLLQPDGKPRVHGADTDPTAPGLHFIGYSNPISGMFREIAIDARRIARAVSASRSAGQRRVRGSWRKAAARS
jgi:putative flavoprotein involved in K+ transport